MGIEKYEEERSEEVLKKVEEALKVRDRKKALQILCDFYDSGYYSGGDTSPW